MLCFLFHFCNRYDDNNSIKTTLCVKNVPSLTGYSFNTHPPIFTIFGTCRQQRFRNRLQV